MTNSTTQQTVEKAVADEERFSAQYASRDADLAQAHTLLRSNARLPARLLWHEGQQQAACPAIRVQPCSAAQLLPPTHEPTVEVI
ncbi:MAG TPA: hypothetical protein VJX30_01130 [Terriglobales bacterium]|nr:hypothetical protein [Terriglobales bacterium]